MSRFSYQSGGWFNTYVLVGAGPIALSPISFLLYYTSILLSAYTVFSQSLATVLSNSNPYPNCKGLFHASIPLASRAARSIAPSQALYPPCSDYAPPFTIPLLLRPETGPSISPAFDLCSPVAETGNRGSISLVDRWMAPNLSLPQPPRRMP